EPTEQPVESPTEQPTESTTEPTEQPAESTTESTEQPAEPTTETTTSDTDKEETQMLHIQAGESEFTAAWADNSSVDALKELLEEGPLTLTMSDYAQMEKGADLGVRLPQNNQQMNTTAGDIILYQGRTLVIYYDQNSWSLTPIAKIEGVDAEKLRAALGDGDVTVTFSLE
uniref:cyclophilin-like fold protein n=1 Tax=uncultured Negativibacillus sp. TaxID=1980696 RepID=UPI0025F832E1